jgi:hypothetical protein
MHELSSGHYVQLIKYSIPAPALQSRAQRCDLHDTCHASIGCVLGLVQCCFQKVELTDSITPSLRIIISMRKENFTINTRQSRPCR